MKERESKKMNFTYFSTEEKSLLKNRINHSIYTYIQRKKLLRYSISIAAASIVVLISIGLFNNITSNSSPLEDFVKTLESNDTESIQNVKLLLNGDQNIEISKENSTIAYSNTGEEVTIDDSKSVNQKTSKSKDIAFNTLIVPYGKRSEITLADGSKVWLNSGSKLVFPASFTGKTREVYLEGEGIFEVTHDKNHPFIVKANNHEIEVLGTVFNVSNYTDEGSISTVLQSGSVKINFKNDSYLNSNESVTISPNTLAVYNKTNKQINTNTVDVEKYFSWRDGVFIFKNDPLHTIMKRISRYYNVNIIINNKTLANETFSGYLDVKDQVENVINTIKETTVFQYEIKGNKIIIN